MFRWFSFGKTYTHVRPGKSIGFGCGKSRIGVLSSDRNFELGRGLRWPESGIRKQPLIL